MDIRIPETHKKPGVFYAVTDDGVELPVIDLTHPSFDPSPYEARLDSKIADFRAEVRRQERVPAFLFNLTMRFMLRKSVLARSLQRATGTFLAGVSTYLFKLGPDHLGSWAAPIDRRVAGSLAALSMRLRLLDMARLLSEGTLPALQARHGRPLRLINVGGGPCIDSINALLFLRRSSPEALDGRRASILALDIEPGGASFGARALAALREPGAPLHGVDAEFTRAAYDWTRPEALRELLAPFREDALAVSSEGALFEYAEDAQVEANLAALREAAPEDAVVTGTATSDTELARKLHRHGVPLKPRSVAALEALVARGGWRIDRLVERPICRDFRLVRR